MNADYEKENVTVSFGKKTLQKIKAELEAEIKADLPAEASSATANQPKLQEYIKKKILKRKNQNQKSSINSEINLFTRAVKLIGNASLREVSTDELQDILIAQKTQSSNLKMLRAFRSLLKFVSRHAEAEKLQPKAYPKARVAYLDYDQIYILAGALDPKEPDKKYKRIVAQYPRMKDLVLIIWNLGIRCSEALGISKEDVRKTKNVTRVLIQRQYVRKKDAKNEADRLRATKNRTKRLVAPINTQETLECLERWLKELPRPTDREKYRYALVRTIKRICRDKFRLNTDESSTDGEFFKTVKEIDSNRVYKAAHMIRASHAIYLAEITDGDVEFIAAQLGDTPDVVRKHYVGVVSAERRIEKVAAKLNEALKKRKA